MSKIHLFKLNKNHNELFPDEKPHSYYFIISKMFDFWEIHPLRPEFVSAYKIKFQKDKFSGDEFDTFTERFVTKFLITDSLTGMAPCYHFEPGVHKSWQLIKWLPRDGKMIVPCVVYFGKEQWKSGHVYEGHHRSGAANCVGWRYIPAIVMNCVGFGEGYCNMTDEDRTEMSKIQNEGNIPNISRIHGVQIALWTDTELRSFMYPRPKDCTKFSMQSLITTECVGSKHSEWVKFGDGPIRLNVGHGVFKSPEVLK